VVLVLKAQTSRLLDLPTVAPTRLDAEAAQISSALPQNVRRALINEDAADNNGGTGDRRHGKGKVSFHVPDCILAVVKA
jgi:hypothetical protein